MRSILNTGLCFSLSLALAATGCGQGQSPESNRLISSGITGGKKTEGQAFNNVVALVSDGKISCTGTLIASNKVLTAAHCLMNTQYMSMQEAKAEFKLIHDEAYKLVPFYLLPFWYASDDYAREYLTKGIQKTLVKKAKVLTIYQGLGTEGGKVGAQRKVTNFKVLPGYMDFLTASIFMNTSLKIASDYGQAVYRPSFDQAILYLDRPYDNVTPAKYITQDEAKELVGVGETLRVVGFGTAVDSRKIIAAGDDMLAADKALKLESDPKKKAKLEIDLAIKALIYEGWVDTHSRQSGVKKLVDVEISTITGGEIEAVPFDSNNPQGVCMGDSGGPAFMLLDDGEYRLLGVISATKGCGQNSIISPVYPHFK